MLRRRKFLRLGRKPDLDRPIPDVYPAADSDLARDNMENDPPAADREDLEGPGQ